MIRLAAAYALADMAPGIGPEHAEAAVAVQSYCARSADVVFSVPVSQLPPRVDPKCAARIVRCLHERYPGWVSRDEIGSGALHGNVPAEALTAALGDLAAKRLAERRRVPTEGRPREEYRLTAPQLALFP